MKQVIYIFVFLLLLVFNSLFVSAYEVKFMYPYSSEEKGEILQIINSIPEQYYYNLKEIKIYNPEKTMFWWAGYYTPNKIQINTQKHHLKTVLQHELAHHQQMLNKDSQNIFNHKGNFCKYYSEILQNNVSYDYIYYCKN